MGKNGGQQEKQVKQANQNVTVDTECPYCRGERKHASSQRKSCKKKGPIKNA